MAKDSISMGTPGDNKLNIGLVQINNSFSGQSYLPYSIGLLQAYAAQQCLDSTPKQVGFASACQAFGHRELHGVLKSFGLSMDAITTYNG